MTALTVDGRAGNTRDRTNTLLQQAERDKPLDSRQKKAVELLCAGLVPKCVCEALGITNSTLQKWRSKPAFKWALSDAMQVDADLHGMRLRQLFGKALDRVNDLLDDKNPHIRLQAARLAFEAEMQICRVAEEQEALKALEQRMEELAHAAIHGSMPNDVHEAEIIEGEVEPD